MISTAAAIIGSSVLGAGASAYGASKQASAAKKGAAAQKDAANQTLAMQQEIYNDQRALQQPYYQAGLQGLYGQSGVMDLLGKGGGGQPMGQSAPQGVPQLQTGQPNYASGNYGVSPMGQQAPQSGNNWSAYLQANPDVAKWAGTAATQPHFTKGAGRAADYNGDGSLSPEEMAQYHYQQSGKGEGRQVPQYQNALAQPATQSTGQVGNAQQVNVNGAPTDPTQGPMTQALRQTPGYLFLQDESKRQIENSFASRGELLSGGAMNALNDRTLGIADQTYQQSVNNNFNLANLGMGAAAQIQGAGSQYGANAGNALANIGNATANGAMGQANAWNAGAQGVGNALMGGVGMYGGMSGWGGGGGATPAASTGTYNGVF
jgi:hypothetical protein